MRRAALVAVTAVLTAGCGGAETRAERPEDPGRAAVAALVAAARDAGAAGVEPLLSRRARRAGAAAALARALAPFASGYRVVVSEQITDRFGAVALARERHALAIPLRREGDAWRAEPGRAVAIEILGPDPGAREVVAQIGVEIHGHGLGHAVLWLDGATLDPRVAAAPGSATVFANLSARVPPGRHVAVAFVTLGDSASARAWTFVAV